MALYLGYCCTNHDYVHQSCKKDALGLARKRAGKLLEEEEAVLAVVKEIAQGAIDAAKELKRRKKINRQGIWRTATLAPEKQIEN